MTDETALKLVDAINRLTDALQRIPPYVSHYHYPQPSFGGGNRPVEMPVYYGTWSGGNGGHQ